MDDPNRVKFDALLQDTVTHGTLQKLTLGKPNGGDDTLKNFFVRPVALKAGTHLCFVYRHTTKDITKNHSPAAGLQEIQQLLGTQFLDAHLFATNQQAQLEGRPVKPSRLRIKAVKNEPATAAPSHDRERQHALPANAPWLRELKVTNDRGQPREGMASKFRQIQKFAELLGHLAGETALPTDRQLQIADMGCGKGYLTFAVAALFGESAQVTGIERRADLVELCNQVATDCGFPFLKFQVGDIGDAATATKSLDILIALHACDTATDDALFQGINATASLLIVSPCCQKELRKQLNAPAVLSDALQHGIFQERQAEFVTDALRAMLLEWAGYRTKVFEFISTEHTAKNLMIAAVKTGQQHDEPLAARIREFAAFYGITRHALATQLNFKLTP
jgi:SAM-dependent methyltransferase